MEELQKENEGTMSEGQPSENPSKQPEAQTKKGRFKAWWQAHKPTKRRIIQLYAALLVNANIKGYVTGRIYTGATKYACVPGLNCYSCPGAVGACPLGALQNALSQSGTRLPFYVIGILLLYGLILGRTICGFLCPLGLVQDLTYKIRTPKLKKSRFTRVLSYLKYVVLVLFAVALPLIFGLGYQTAVPAFCKYICPAGVLGGAVPLLINPSNASLFDMLGGLFTWKFCLMIAILVASVFIYRIFCRFLCPLGALYGFFNRIALLGIKLDKNKCTDCGLCVAHCKMDIKKVGDHECINCGECISVCPAKAISWKGSKLFVHPNATEQIPAPSTERPLGAVMSSAPQDPHEQPDVPAASVSRKKKGKAFWLEAAAWLVAIAVLAGALVYFNACDNVTLTLPPKEFAFTVGSLSSAAGEQTFTVRREGETPNVAAYRGGSGTEEDPYAVDDIAGIYSVTVGDSPVYFTFSLTAESSYTVEGGADLDLSVFFYNAYGQKTAVYSSSEGNRFTLSCVRGVGEYCPDFTLPRIGGGGDLNFSALKGKVVIINFWATWCGPCVTELPAFEQIMEAYEGQAEVVAVHSSHITEDVVSFIASKQDALVPARTWKDWKLSFVQDSGEEPASDVYDMLGGRDSYPMTVIVDQDGVIVFRREGSVTYDDLLLQMRLLLET